MSPTAAGARGVQLLEGEAAGPMYGAVGQGQSPTVEQPVMVNGYGRPLDQDMMPGAAVVREAKDPWFREAGSGRPRTWCVNGSGRPRTCSLDGSWRPRTWSIGGSWWPRTSSGCGAGKPTARNLAALSYPDSAETWAPGMRDLVQATGSRAHDPSSSSWRKCRDAVRGCLFARCRAGTNTGPGHYSALDDEND